jgi:hypothetical protein
VLKLHRKQTEGWLKKPVVGRPRAVVAGGRFGYIRIASEPPRVRASRGA